MKATYRTARSNAKGQVYKAKHNDRQFDFAKAEHIDSAKTEKNKLYLCTMGYFEKSDGRLSFEEHELNEYNELFRPAIEARNKRYRESRHSEGCKTIDDIYRSKRYCPEELILQIGSKEKTISEEQMESITVDYAKRFNEEWGDNCRILDIAIHVDETTPHAHIRRVWSFEGKDGLDIGQNKALAEMGIERPDMSKETSRYNNAKQTFTAMDRELWREVALQHGINVEEYEHAGRKRKHEEIDHYRSEIEQLKKTIRNLEAELQKKNRQIDKLHAEFKSWTEKPEIRDFLALRKTARDNSREQQIDDLSR